MDAAYQSAKTVAEELTAKENLLETKEYIEATGIIDVPLGVSDSGQVIVRDLSDIPHILVCGCTASGKTSFVQTLLAVIESKLSPEDVKILIYDSKGVEYTAFKNTPILLSPVCTSQDSAIEMILWLSDESRRRFKLFAEDNCKDFKKFNSRQHEKKDCLPEIFMILDDFASLTLGKDHMYEFLNVVKNGRIAGIHLIVVSSLTSAKALNKELLSNIPCRISFRLSSKTESRAVLEQTGAENLLVPGEMIFKFQNECKRCFCAYTPYENIQKTVQMAKGTLSLKKLGDMAVALFDTDPVMNTGKRPVNPKTDAKSDELLFDAGCIVIEDQKPSIGYLQRELRLGFNRVANIMDELQMMGVVSEPDFFGERQVLMTEKEWEATCGVKKAGNINKNDSTKSITDEPAVKLRDFPSFCIGETLLSISNNKINYSKPIMTRFGEGTLTPSFTASNITKIIYKKPSLLSNGYFTFEFSPDTRINNTNPELLQAGSENISELIKVDFSLDNNNTIMHFLNQISEDSAIPITRR